MLKVLPWLVWGQIAIDAVMFVFWIAAAATSRFGCSDLCDACANLLLEYNLECPCQVTLYDTYPYANPYDKRDMSPAPRGLAGALEARRVGSSSSRGSRYVAAHRNDSIKARTAFDALMVYARPDPFQWNQNAECGHT